MSLCVLICKMRIIRGCTEEQIKWESTLETMSYQCHYSKQDTENLECISTIFWLWTEAVRPGKSNYADYPSGVNPNGCPPILYLESVSSPIFLHILSFSHLFPYKGNTVYKISFQPTLMCRFVSVTSIINYENFQRRVFFTHKHTPSQAF